ncbi:hypothetical protein ACIRPQ_28905 [Streptomyces sp. NPDC101213]|uniref:hypothetical protein n=1 Tax=Streptomyces sp. NPDC101213 TaxID=3366130 RepID=UPI0037F9BEBA
MTGTRLEGPLDDDGYQPRGKDEEFWEFYGDRYVMTGVCVGSDDEFWGAKRLPYQANMAACDINDGESLPTRAACLKRMEQEAYWRHLARAVHHRHPALIGPLPFTLEPRIEELEPGYERIIWLGQEHRLHIRRGDLKELRKTNPKWVRSPATTAARTSDVGEPRVVQMHMIRAAALSAVLHPETVRLLGTTRPDTDCWMCEPGPAWGRHKKPKVRIGLLGQPELEAVLCVHHALGYWVPYEVQRRGHDVIPGPWMVWQAKLAGWFYEMAHEAEGGPKVVPVLIRWHTYLASVAAEEHEAAKAAERDAKAEEKKKASEAKDIGAGVKLSRDGRTVHYEALSYRVVRDGPLWAARDGRRPVCEYLPKAAFIRAVREYAQGQLAQGELFDAQAG